MLKIIRNVNQDAVVRIHVTFELEGLPSYLN